MYFPALLSRVFWRFVWVPHLILAMSNSRRFYLVEQTAAGLLDEPRFGRWRVFAGATAMGSFGNERNLVVGGLSR